MVNALITGVTGQDGSYLAEFLLNKGYNVFGIVRRTSTFNRIRIDHLQNNPNFKLLYGDLTDSSSISLILRKVMPDEVYNLAAQSHVQVSFEVPEYTGDVNALGVLRFLEAIKKLQEQTGKQIKFYQASTSEMFGKAIENPQKETTPFYPRSPYGCSKVYAFWITKNYKESYNMFTCNGILFNHESPRRGENFVTKKITMEVAKIKIGISTCFSIGNLNSKRDWGHAKDYIEAMWLMMKSEKPTDYVIATGETHTVREFLEETFKLAGIEVESNGKEGVDEEYIRKDTGEVVVKIDPRFFRPSEVDCLLGDPSKAKEELGWSPRISFKELVKEMFEYDLLRLKK
jgi:GDPmannose 4,6-dehydratase